MSETNTELRQLGLGLSELLKSAIANHGELSADQWARMETLQRRAYVLKHPEVAPDSSLLEGESAVLRGEASLEQADMSDPEAGPPYELVVDGVSLSHFVEDNFDVSEHTFSLGHSMKLGKLRVLVEVCE